MEIDKKQMKKWIKALRSGKYKQTKATLQDSNGYCCLGVACKELIPDDKINILYGTLYGSLPRHQPYAPEWLVHINVHFSKLFQYEFCLTTMNDNDGYTFEDIADVLELVYIYGALDEQA